MSLKQMARCGFLDHVTIVPTILGWQTLEHQNFEIVPDIEKKHLEVL